MTEVWQQLLIAKSFIEKGGYAEKHRIGVPARRLHGTAIGFWQAFHGDAEAVQEARHHPDAAAETNKVDIEAGDKIGDHGRQRIGGIFEDLDAALIAGMSSGKNRRRAHLLTGDFAGTAGDRRAGCQGFDAAAPAATAKPTGPIYSDMSCATGKTAAPDLQLAIEDKAGTDIR